MNAETETRVLEASADIADGPYDVDRHEQQIAVGSAWGVITMFPKGETSIEVHGLDKKQAAAVLRALTPGYVVLATVDLKRNLFQEGAAPLAIKQARELCRCGHPRSAHYFRGACAAVGDPHDPTTECHCGEFEVLT